MTYYCILSCNHHNLCSFIFLFNTIMSCDSHLFSRAVLYSIALCCIVLPLSVSAQTVDAGSVNTSTTKPGSAVTISTTSTMVTSQPSKSSSTVISYSSEKAPYPWCIQQLFKISGYYSPKPAQDVYTRDTYDAEIRLNGRGVHGASGAPVFNGMVAAPKSYAFGTVIILPGLGVWQVKDRWWAIVASDWYDRIDVWVGEWDEGIHRAKSIGLRWVVWWYCPESATSQIGLDWDGIPHYSNFTQVAFWSISQNIGRSGPLVTLAQDYLRKLWYLSTDVIPGVYNQQMSHLVCRFQIDALWLSGSEDYCGTLWPTTRSKLKSKLVQAWIVSDGNIYWLDNSSAISSMFTKPNVRPAWNYEEQQSSSVLLVDQSQATSQVVIKTAVKKPSSSSNIQDSSPNLKIIVTSFDTAAEIGDSNNMIVVLQKVLAFEKLYDYKITWYFWSITESALTQFQLKYNLIDSSNHPAAWHLWPATRALLTKKQKLLRLKFLDT